MAKTQGHGNPKWSREEIILALDLYFKLNGKIPDESDSRVGELSTFLRAMPRVKPTTLKDSFRNKTGIVFKLQNIRQLATGKGFGNVSQTDRDIWDQYGTNPSLVNLIATQIKERLQEVNALTTEEVADDDFEFSEGALLTRVHKLKERKPSVRRFLISNRQAKGGVQCDVCGFKGATKVPELLESQFEAHHIVPLAFEGKRRTKLSDMALLCANCHRLIHKAISMKKTWISIDELKKLVAIS